MYYFFQFQAGGGNSRRYTYVCMTETVRVFEGEGDTERQRAT